MITPKLTRKFIFLLASIIGLAMPFLMTMPARAVATDPYYCPVKPVLKYGDQGICVKNLQWHLKNTPSLTYATRFAVRVNGFYDWATETAVLSYKLNPIHLGINGQPLNSGTVNSVADLNVWCAIYRSHGRSCASLVQPVHQSAAYYAQLILQNPHISIQPQTVGIVQRVANGLCAPVEATGQCVQMSATLLHLINDMANSGIPINIAYLTNGHHVTDSFHYRGQAVDIGNQQAHDLIMPYVYNHRGLYNVNELIYSNSPLNLKNGVLHHYDPATEADHRDHIHIAVDTE